MEGIVVMMLCALLMVILGAVVEVISHVGWDAVIYPAIVLGGVSCLIVVVYIIILPMYLLIFRSKDRRDHIKNGTLSGSWYCGQVPHREVLEEFPEEAK